MIPIYRPRHSSPGRAIPDAVDQPAGARLSDAAIGLLKGRAVPGRRMTLWRYRDARLSHQLE